MLDVHVPHAPPYGWREFLTHIVAIAVGLLLALALEKAVEVVHERHQLSQARRELAAELQDNFRQLQKNQAEAERIQRSLLRDLALIQALRAHAVPDGKFDYTESFYSTLDGAWQAARQSGALDLMPHEELVNYAWFHQLLGYVMDALHGLEPTMKIAGAIAASAAPEQINARDLEELASRTMEAQGRLENYRMFLEFEAGGLHRLRGDNAPSVRQVAGVPAIDTVTESRRLKVAITPNRNGTHPESVGIPCIGVLSSAVSGQEPERVMPAWGCGVPFKIAE